MICHKEDNLHTMSQFNLKVTVSHQISAAILLLSISAATGYYAQGNYLEQ